ncbi:MAG TPA: GDP-mannose 4,6-dehydratase [Gemmatimonadaceae bacterium]|nr:GDP-mannose 4,6-dehydratase [Gemmatimonadaceae bacterium]
MTKSMLLTGGAGFIGSNLADSLLDDGWRVTVVDCFSDYYDPASKRQNVERQLDHDSYSLVEADIRDLETLERRLDGEYDVIVHLAACVGVRPSIEQPLLYEDVNNRGTHHMLALARRWKVKQFVFGSSSSVYGVNPHLPWSEDEAVLMPISPYASSKVSSELLGHAYSRLFGMRFVALRFFTVYGPRQRPDLAIHKFARKIMDGLPIPLFGDGSSMRDYTCVSDIVSGIRAAMEYEGTQYEVFNLGNGHPVKLSELVRGLERVLEKRAEVESLPIQQGDVPFTWANVAKASRLLGYEPRTPLDRGLEEFAAWLTASRPA